MALSPGELHSSGSRISASALAAELEQLRHELAGCDPPRVRWQGPMRPDADHEASVTNLGHYLALRRHDLRATQDILSELGMSSLGRCEGHVYSSVWAVSRALAALCGDAADGPRPTPHELGAPTVLSSGEILARRSTEVLGPEPVGHDTRLMVTLPLDAAKDPTIIDRVARAGVGLLRINTGHGELGDWTAMIQTARETSDRLGVELRVALDLTGPKVRTGEQPSVRLRIGDEVRLVARRGQIGDASTTALFTCSQPEALVTCVPGHRVIFDDGKLAGEVTSVEPDDVRVRITYAPPSGAKLRGRKGINLPDSDPRLAPMTRGDVEALEKLAPAVDLVSLSFVRRPKDLLEVRAKLAELHRPDLPIIVKIETAQGFRSLPQILVAGLGSGALGVMVARGDLAVEVGYERLAEVQEEILWLCEAAHVPTIWATQVLDGLAKTGRPSRAEISDAAMASRAEAAMLNKGRFQIDAVRTLDEILRRMSRHQHKKRSLMPRLAAWDRVLDTPVD